MKLNKYNFSNEANYKDYKLVSRKEIRHNTKLPTESNFSVWRYVPDK